MRRPHFLILGALLAVLAFTAIAQFGRPPTEEFLRNRDGQALIQAFSVVQQHHLDKVDLTTLIDGAMRGMLEALDDRFSSYSPPQQAAQDAEIQTGEFSGIGATLISTNRDGTGVEVLSLFPTGAAFESGMAPGDRFIRVNGEDATRWTTSEVARRVRGPEGTVVQVTVQRPGVSQPIEFSLQRRRITLISVSTAMLPGAVGYLQLQTFFTERVIDQFREGLATLRRQGARALILDLRENSGGLVDQGVKVADEFLNSGDVVWFRSQGVTTRAGAASPGGEWTDRPVVVLVNRNSASASEIVAGALQDLRRAPIVGTRTFGKGVAQIQADLVNGGRLVLVNKEWLTPARRAINEAGIEPDVIVADTRGVDRLTLEGSNAAPNSTIEVRVDGQVMATFRADDAGSFSFLAPVRPGVRQVTDGVASFDLEADAQLRRALAIAQGAR